MKENPLRQILSHREFEIIELMAVHGFNNQEAAKKLFLSPNTISTHLSRAIRKMNARHPSHAISLYWNWRSPGDREADSWSRPNSAHKISV